MKTKRKDFYRLRFLSTCSTRMAEVPQSGRFDLVVFGATGYTGQYVVEEVARIAKMEKEKQSNDSH